MQVREPRMAENRASAVIDRSEKISLVAWAGRNFSPLMSGMKNRIFAFFAVLSHRKLLLFVPDNNHTTQEYTGGVWFFIAATPKHHGRKSIVRNAEPHEKRTEHRSMNH